MIDAVVETGQILGDFAVGALYEFILNEIDSADVTVDLTYNLISIALGDSLGVAPMGNSDDLIDGYLETRLPQTAAFYAGRIVGSGAGLVAAYYKFLIGAPIAGKGIALSASAGVVTQREEVTLIGAALSGAIVTNSTASAFGALDGALENTAILMAMSGASDDDWADFFWYNNERPHQSLDYRTPGVVYKENLEKSISSRQFE